MSHGYNFRSNKKHGLSPPLLENHQPHKKPCLHRRDSFEKHQEYIYTLQNQQLRLLPSPLTKEELINKAAAFWKFLDDLALNDQGSYKDFIDKCNQTCGKMVESKLNDTNSNEKNTDKQLWEELEEHIKITKHNLNSDKPSKNQYYFTPIPFMVIETKISVTKKDVIGTLSNVKNGQRLYINFQESPYCKPLCSVSNPGASITDKTPLSELLVHSQVSPLFNEQKEKQYWRCDVIYHDTVYKWYGAQHSDTLIFKKGVIEYALRQIEHQNSIKLSRNYRIMRNEKFYGVGVPKAQFIGDKTIHKAKEIEIKCNDNNHDYVEKKNINDMKDTKCNDNNDKDAADEKKKGNDLIIHDKTELNVKPKELKKVIDCIKQHRFLMISISILLFTFICTSFLSYLNDQDCAAPFPTVKYNDRCYATLTGLDPYSTDNTGCESTFASMSEGWSIASAGSDTTAVAEAYYWGTQAMVFGYPSESRMKGETWATTKNWNGNCVNCYVVYNTSNQWRSSYCNIAVLITRMPTIATGEAKRLDPLELDLLSVLHISFILMATFLLLAHCCLMTYPFTNKRLLILTKICIFLIFMSVTCQSLAYLLPVIDIHKSWLSMVQHLSIQSWHSAVSGDDDISICCASLFWTVSWVTFTSACYIFKFTYIKRVMLFRRSPIYQKQHGLSFGACIYLILLVDLLLCAACFWIIMERVDAECILVDNHYGDYVLHYDLYTVHFAKILIWCYISSIHVPSLKDLSLPVYYSLRNHLYLLLLAQFTVFLDGVIHLQFIDHSSSSASSASSSQILLIISEIDSLIIGSCCVLTLSKAQQKGLNLLGITKYDKFYETLQESKLIRSIL